MNPINRFLVKVFIYFSYKKGEFLFERSKKYITSWGEGTYGMPTILCYDKKSTLSVGAYCSIASEVTFLIGANHKKGTIPTYPIDRIDSTKSVSDSNERSDITIGSDVWIGYGATVLGGSTIGHGAIIGTKALVAGDIPPYAVAVGVPAKVIRYRFSDQQIADLLTIAWWDRSGEEVTDMCSDLYELDTEAFISKYKTT